MLDNETKRRIDTARDILVGKVPDPKSQVEQITIALIYKFMDDMDAEAEELGGKRKFFSNEFDRYGWKKLMAPDLGGFDVLTLYAEAIQKMNINPNIPQLFRDIFKNAYLPYRDPETLKSFLKIIDDFEYSHSEKLGDAFEYLLSVLGSQGDAGQFRTPRHIIDFMVDIIDPKKDETILDPACGTAGFLISSYKHILKHNSTNFVPEKDKEAFEQTDTSIAELSAGGIKRYNGDKLTPDERAKLSKNIKGYDISPDMVRLSLVNLYLHGFTDPKIYEYDTLTSEDNWNEYADIVLANPPFMSPKGGIKPHKRFSIQSNRSEVLFVDYMVEHLTPNGKAAIIVPEGIIFQSGNAYKQLRKMLVENYLFAVVSLPAGVFQPYSGVKTSILLIDRALNKKTDKIIFVKIENDGFDLGAQRRPNNKSQLPIAVKLVKEYIASCHSALDVEPILTDKFGPNNLWNIATKEKIAENGDWNLSGERYKSIVEISSSFPQFILGNLFETSSGGTPLKKEENYFKNGTIPWIKSGEVAQGLIYKSEEFITKEGLENSSAKIFPINTVLVAMYGTTVGQAGLLKIEASTNQAVCGIYPNEKVVPEYLYYILKAKRQYLISLSSGGAQPNISQRIIRELIILLPPLEIQKEIVAEIEGWQKIIDGARQVVENYKPQIDIDPEWPMVELENYIDFVSGLTLSIPDCEDKDGVPIIAINNVTEEGELTLEGLRTIKLPKQKTINFLKKGDLLFNWRNGSKRLVGKTALFDLEGEYVFASFLLGIRPKENLLLHKYLWYLLNNYRRDGKYEQFMRQNINGLFNREELKILKIPLPSIKEQESIVNRIQSEQKLVESNKELITLFEQKIKDKIAKVWGE